VQKEVFNCRDFECGLNKKGECPSPRIELVPDGGLRHRLICLQREEKEKPKEIPEPTSGQ